MSKGFSELTKLGQVSLIPERLISAELADCIAFSHYKSFMFCVMDYLVVYHVTFFSFFRLMGGKC